MRRSSRTRGARDAAGTRPSVPLAQPRARSAVRPASVGRAASAAPKTTLDAGRRDHGRRARQRAGEHPWLLGSFVEDPLPDARPGALGPLQRGAAAPGRTRHVRLRRHSPVRAGGEAAAAAGHRHARRRRTTTSSPTWSASLIPENPDVVNLSLGPTPVDEKGETDEGVAHDDGGAGRPAATSAAPWSSPAAGDIGEELPARAAGAARAAEPHRRGARPQRAAGLVQRGQAGDDLGARRGRAQLVRAPQRSGVALASTRPRACARRYRCRCRGPWRGRCPRPCPRPCRGPCRGPCRDFGAVGAAARTVRGLGPVERDVVRGARSERCDRRRDQRARRRRRSAPIAGSCGRGQSSGCSAGRGRSPPARRRPTAPPRPESCSPSCRSPCSARRVTDRLRRTGNGRWGLVRWVDRGGSRVDRPGRGGTMSETPRDQRDLWHEVSRTFEELGEALRVHLSPDAARSPSDPTHPSEGRAGGPADPTETEPAPWADPARPGQSEDFDDPWAAATDPARAAAPPLTRPAPPTRPPPARRIRDRPHPGQPKPARTPRARARPRPPPPRPAPTHPDLPAPHLAPPHLPAPAPATASGGGAARPS